MEEPSEVKKFYSSEHILRSFKKMAHFKFRSQLCDVTLVAGEKHIPCHRVVIAAFSDYFSAMFTREFPELNKDVIHLCEMDSDALEALIKYAYTAELEIRVDNVENLLSVACMLQINEVQEACCEFMEHQLHPSNCLGIRAFADGHGCKELFKKADQFTTDRFNEVIRNQEFLLLSNKQVGELLASDDLNVTSESQVLDALMLWANNDSESRKAVLPELLGKIRLPLLAPQYLVDNVECCPLFQGIPACRELILEAMKFQLLPERRFQLQSSRTRPRKSTVGSLYVVGGMDTTKGPTNIERYDRRTNSWSTIAPTSTKRLQFGSAVLQNHLYIVGGRDGLRTLNTVERFNPHTKEWSTVTSMNTHRHGVGVGILGGPIYAVGGHDGWSYLNTVERYDHNTRQWSFVSSMCTPRSTVGVGVLDGKLYAVGGRDGSSCLNSVESYNPHTNKWTMVCPMMKRRGGVGVSVLGGYLYALGGHDAPASQDCSKQFDSVERYDSNTDQWTMIAPMLKCRDAVGVSWLGDRLYAIGGFDGTGYLKAVECYDPIANEWHEAAPLKIGRAGACAVTIENNQQ